MLLFSEKMSIGLIWSVIPQFISLHKINFVVLEVDGEITPHAAQQIASQALWAFQLAVSTMLKLRLWSNHLDADIPDARNRSRSNNS